VEKRLRLNDVPTASRCKALRSSPSKIAGSKSARVTDSCPRSSVSFCEGDYDVPGTGLTEITNANRILVIKHLGKRPLGRSR
jgi:hypothetical protein